MNSNLADLTVRQANGLGLAGLSPAAPISVIMQSRAKCSGSGGEGFVIGALGSTCRRQSKPPLADVPGARDYLAAPAARQGAPFVRLWQRRGRAVAFAFDHSAPSGGAVGEHGPIITDGRIEFLLSEVVDTRPVLHARATPPTRISGPRNGVQTRRGHCPPGRRVPDASAVALREHRSPTAARCAGRGVYLGCWRSCRTEWSSASAARHPESGSATRR